MAARPHQGAARSGSDGPDAASLVLFDIDGTLLTTDGAARRAFEAALIELFGTAGPIDGHSFAGKTDPQIVRELLEATGMEQADIDAALPTLWRRYLELLRDELGAGPPPRVYPGVREVLARLDGDSGRVLPGLLTGNIREGARYKLQSARIEFDRFPVGAFGSDHADRDELPAVAVQRASRLTGRRFAGKSVVIVGDTPADIACGESLGVRTVAVATGIYDIDELAACHPDHLFPTLEDVDAVWAALTAAS